MELVVGVNKKYRDQIDAEGLGFSGTPRNGKVVEFVELPREVYEGRIWEVVSDSFVLSEEVGVPDA